MFDYTTERIVNSKGFFFGPKHQVTYLDNGEEKTADWNKIGFLDGWNFDPKLVKEVDYKEGEPAVNEVATIDLGKDDNVKNDREKEMLKDATAERLTIVLHQEGRGSEWQNALTRNAKVIILEAKRGANIADFKKALDDQYSINKNIKVKMDNSGKLTATNPSIRIDKEATKHEAVIVSLLGIESTIDLGAKVSIKTSGSLGFGTAELLTASYHLPTAEHTRYMAIDKDQRPIDGAVYDQVTFHVEADRDPLTGMGAVGQKLTSVTTHVLFVKHDVWEEEMKNLFKEPEKEREITKYTVDLTAGKLALATESDTES